MHSKQMERKQEISRVRVSTLAPEQAARVSLSVLPYCWRTKW